MYTVNFLTVPQYIVKNEIVVIVRNGSWLFIGLARTISMFSILTVQ